ncbi:MAG: hypothetical protein HZA61_00320 [Candidatus Eisenbacteria bacterium]|uniref:Uncharacterized protein n=1 Tax=Eiseniibacteriota bacterium TaxID=2212470 RepID=A0A933W712_UNCEI|nr:hypothetical protein [Candidatus Eisenbacteria bacterium]
MPRANAWILVLLLLLHGAAPARAAAVPDSAAATHGVRVFSDRALFDLNPRPSNGHAPNARAVHVADSLHLPSPGAASALTLAGTLVPVLMLSNWDDLRRTQSVLITSGLTLAVIGPSLGYLYAGIPTEALPGDLLRLGALGVAAFTIYGPWMDSESDVVGAVGTLVLGTVVFAGATLYDIGNVGPAVRRENDRRIATATVGLRPLPDGRPALALSFRF